MKANVLVVANRTAASPDLIACLRERAERSPARFQILIPPATRGEQGRADARRNLDAALEALDDEDEPADEVAAGDDQGVGDGLEPEDELEPEDA